LSVAASTGPLAWPEASPGIASAFNRFLVANIAFRRVHQLQFGARARVDRGNHKPTRIALLETLADAISWTAGEPVAAQD
jgi:DNA-directed RNA polymerase subunit K/omega